MTHHNWHIATNVSTSVARSGRVGQPQRKVKKRMIHHLNRRLATRSLFINSSMRSTYFSGTDRAALAEFDVVRVRATLGIDGAVIPAGSVGAIVHAHRDGGAFEIEFEKPVAAVVTLEAGEIERA